MVTLKQLTSKIRGLRKQLNKIEKRRKKIAAKRKNQFISS